MGTLQEGTRDLSIRVKVEEASWPAMMQGRNAISIQDWLQMHAPSLAALQQR